MSEEDTKATMSTPTPSDRVSPSEKEKIAKLVELLTTFMPENEGILAVNCIVVTLHHDGSEDRKTCGLRTRHMGGAADPHALEAMVAGTIKSVALIQGRAALDAQLEEALRDAPLDDKKGN